MEAKAKIEIMGKENANTLSNLRKRDLPSQTHDLVFREKDSALQSRKLRLQCQELRRRNSIKRKIQEREKGAAQRLQQTKNRQHCNFSQHQNTWFPVSQEKDYKSLKRIHNSLGKNDSEAQTLSAKQQSTLKANEFKVYHKAGKASELPRIRKQRIGAKEDTEPPRNHELSLVDFGIFSEKKKGSAFLKKLRAKLEKEFVAAIDLSCEVQVRKLESLIVGQVGGGGWLAAE